LINVEQIQQTTKELGESAMSSAQTLATSVQTIATAHADYAKKAMQDGSEFISKLTSVKEPAKVMELHSEYVKSAYQTFVAEAKKNFRTLYRPLQADDEAVTRFD
jgi:hypothetical protein